MENKKAFGIKGVAILIFFIAHFFYFLFLNKYHLIYQEQVQLFRFDGNYFLEFFARPGGISDYLGTFLIQFYYVPALGAMIVTITGFLVFILSSFIFRKYHIAAIIASVLPVTGLILLQNDPFFTISYIVGLIFSLAAVAVYINLKTSKIRYFSGVILWFILYIIAGGFSVFALLLFALHELFYSKNLSGLFVISAWVLAAVLIPYLSWLYVYQIPLKEAWFTQNFMPSNIQTRWGFLIVLVYFYLVPVFSVLWKNLPDKPFVAGWKQIGLIVTSVSILIFFTFPGIRKIAEDHRRIATVIKIDGCIQNKEWEEGIRISSGYKETDPLVIFFTNICLLKTGHLSDRMFYFNQAGRNGLFLNWTEDNVTPFFGGEIFYQLGYNNESYRWAFEAFIATGACPRVLKRLVISSIMNGDDKIAGKYIELLDDSPFYHKWADGYRKFLKKEEPGIIPDELNYVTRLEVNDDFFCDPDFHSKNMRNLLVNNPGNRVLYEYTMALHLLEKDLPAFISGLSRLKEYGYKALPVHFEEALLIYIVNTNQDVVPEGYSISESTMQRFRHYININTTYIAKPKIEAAAVLEKEYGNTYWYYSQFF